MSKLDLNNIQGDILLDGLPKRVESFFFFQIADGHVKDFCLSLKQIPREIAHVDNTAQMRQDINNGKAARKEGGLVEMAGANIAFSWKGLQRMATVLAKDIGNPSDNNFTDGMKAHAIGTTASPSSIGDPIKPGTNEPNWEDPFTKPELLHGVVLVTGNDDAQVKQKLDSIKKVFQSSIKELKTISGKVRPAPFKGHEHFGFNDGISQPAIDGVDKAPKGQDTIDQGVILCNRGSNAGQHPDWMTDGSFMCFRKLEQNVPAWNKFLVDASNTLGTWSGQLGARLIGRWPSGCPVQLSPEFDDKNIAADPSRTNDFDFDSPGSANVDFRCPMAAHIRKTNPRNDLGSRGPNGNVNRFRILRRGIPYGNELDADPKGTRGLLFVCYQSTISNGFAFIQGQWANERNFVKQGVGLDAVLGQLSKDEQVNTTGMFPQDAKRPVKLNAVSPFVVPKGGEYFFTPSIAALTGVLADVKGGKSEL
ncbi:hypothetical protein Q7P36_011057 [Cladosporium allicinum]